MSFGANYTDHKKSLTPDEAYVQFTDPTSAQIWSFQSKDLLDRADFSWIGLGHTLAFDPQQLLNDGIYTLVSNNSNPDVAAKAYDVHEKFGNDLRPGGHQVAARFDRADRQHRRAGGSHRSAFEWIPRSLGRPACSPYANQRWREILGRHAEHEPVVPLSERLGHPRRPRSRSPAPAHGFNACR